MANKKYTKKFLKEAVKDCTSFRQLILKLGLKETGGNYNNLQNRCKEFGIDTSHFTGQLWNVAGNPIFDNKLNIAATFCIRSKKRPSTKTKELIFSHHLKEKKCEICGCKDWLGKPLMLQLHHKNGNPLDDRLENLQILCPNCHSQTDTFCKRKEIRSTKQSTQDENSDVNAG